MEEVGHWLRACTHKGADVDFRGVSRNLELQEEIGILDAALDGLQIDAASAAN